MQELENLVVAAANTNNTIPVRHEAFGELVHRFQDLAYASAYAILGDVYLAQDAVQEAFVTAYKKLDQLREPLAFPGWLKQLTLSQCHRLIRGKRIPTNPIDSTEHLGSNALDPAVAIEDNELRDKVLAAIQALPEREQEVTKLFYLNGYSQKEIAKLLEIPVTTVKKRLQYARKTLKGMMMSMMDSLYPQPQPVPIPIPVRISHPPEQNYPY